MCIRDRTEDNDKMDDTWEDWKSNHFNAKKYLIENGAEVKDILVKPKDWLMYCKEKALRLNTDSRAQFIGYKTSQYDK